LVVLLGVVALASGCTLLPKPYQLAEDAPKASDLENLVLLPMNFDHLPRPALAPGTESMGARVRGYLESRGYRVLTPKMSTTLGLWKSCTVEVGGITDESGTLDAEQYARARALLVRRTLEALPADGVVASTVLVRKARYSGHNLVWDGVMRPVRVDMGDSNRFAAYLRGQGEGISLRTSVFERDGDRIFERYAGLEPLREFRADEGVLVRKDLFLDEPLLEEAIVLSFEPWLMPPPAETE
jgi:hypothetical protein